MIGVIQTDPLRGSGIAEPQGEVQIVFAIAIQSDRRSK